MKYKVLPLILVLILAGCHGRPKGDADPVSTSANDSIKRRGGLFDSIHDSRLRGIVANDSIEILSVRHTHIDTYAVEQILYLDRTAGRNSTYTMPIPALIPDSPAIKLNPVPEMKGMYAEVFSYKGRFMTANVGDIDNSQEMIIADSAIIWIPNGFDILLYKRGERKENKVTYIVSDRNNKIDTIEIRILGGELKMQLWKWPQYGDKQYALMVPLDRLRSLPQICAVNDKWMDGNMDVQFDRINYDSLMSGK